VRPQLDAHLCIPACTAPSRSSSSLRCSLLLSVSVRLSVGRYYSHKLGSVVREMTQALSIALQEHSSGRICRQRLVSIGGSSARADRSDLTPVEPHRIAAASERNGSWTRSRHLDAGGRRGRPSARATVQWPVTGPQRQSSHGQRSRHATGYLLAVRHVLAGRLGPGAPSLEPGRLPSPRDACCPAQRERY
jgi:hypothetical protein